MAESRKLTESKKLTLDTLQVGEEFSDDHLVIPDDTGRVLVRGHFTQMSAWIGTI